MNPSVPLPHGVILARRDAFHWCLRLFINFALFWQVLMAVGKVTSKGSGTAVAQLSNQATVMENGAHAHPRKLDAADAKPNALAAMRAAWNYLRGWLAGILAAIISMLYTVSCPVCCKCEMAGLLYDLPCSHIGQVQELT